MLYLYVFSISAQLSGALILLLWSCSKIGTNVLDMCFSGVTFAKRNNSGEVYIEKETIRRKVKTIFLNVWAFIYIAFGYLTSVFAPNNEENLWLKAILIIGFTAILLLIAVICSQYVSAAWGRTDRVLTAEEVIKYNVPTTVSEQEISELFKE